jgi:hypothetical protein
MHAVRPRDGGRGERGGIAGAANIVGGPRRCEDVEAGAAGQTVKARLDAPDVLDLLDVPWATAGA